MGDDEATMTISEQYVDLAIDGIGRDQIRDCIAV